jgi:hypothetical protein
MKQRNHPFANRPLVDWIALKLVLPNLLAGTPPLLQHGHTQELQMHSIWQKERPCHEDGERQE